MDDPIISADYEDMVNKWWWLWRTSDPDLTDLFMFSLPEEASYSSSAFRDFNLATNTKQAFASSQCKAYEMSFVQQNLPCLSPSLKQSLDSFSSDKDYSDIKLNKFFDDFGTHAIMGATFGGKIVQQSEFNHTQLREMGISGDVVFDPTDGWCNYESSS